MTDTMTALRHTTVLTAAWLIAKLDIESAPVVVKIQLYDLTEEKIESTTI